MIDDFVRFLDEQNLDFSAEEIADILWLASKIVNKPSLNQDTDNNLNRWKSKAAPESIEDNKKITSDTPRGNDRDAATANKGNVFDLIVPVAWNF